MVLPLAFSIHKVKSSSNRDNFTSFLMWMTFIYFYYLIALARNSITMLNRVGECEYLCLVPNLENLLAFHCWVRCYLRVCSIWPLLCCGCFSTHFVDSFYHQRMLNFAEWFFCIYWSYHMIFSTVLMWGIIFIDLLMLNNPCTPEKKIPLDHCTWYFQCAVEFGLLVFCWGYVHLYSSGRVFFSCGVFFWLRIKRMLAS